MPTTEQKRLIEQVLSKASKRSLIDRTLDENFGFATQLGADYVAHADSLRPRQPTEEHKKKLNDTKYLADTLKWGNEHTHFLDGLRRTARAVADKVRATPPERKIHENVVADIMSHGPVDQLHDRFANEDERTFDSKVIHRADRTLGRAAFANLLDDHARQVEEYHRSHSAMMKGLTQMAKRKLGAGQNPGKILDQTFDARSKHNKKYWNVG